MNIIPLVKGNTQEEINTSLIALKKALDEMNSSSSKTDASVQSQIKQINELITNINSHLDTIDGQITDLQPVDSVTSGDMHSVTSNAVAEKLIDYQSKEWKILEGYNISGIEYDEVAVSVWFEYANTEVVYSKQFSKGMLGVSQVLVIGGYYISANDYGLCNLNFTNGLFGLRNVYYAGQNFKSVSGMRIRYR